MDISINHMWSHVVIFGAVIYVMKQVIRLPFSGSNSINVPSTMFTNSNCNINLNHSYCLAHKYTMIMLNAQQ